MHKNINLKKIKSTHRGVLGFSLIEVLVALVILSVGLMGVSKLVLATEKGNDSASMGTQALILANLVLENMRANASAASSQAYDVAIGTTPSSGGCINTSCTATQVATADLASWKAGLAKLPSGDGSVVTNTNGNYTTATITVQWNDKRAVNAFGGSTVSQFTLESVL